MKLIDGELCVCTKSCGWTGTKPAFTEHSEVSEDGRVKHRKWIALCPGCGANAKPVDYAPKVAA